MIPLSISIKCQKLYLAFVNEMGGLWLWKRTCYNKNMEICQMAWCYKQINFVCFSLGAADMRTNPSQTTVWLRLQVRILADLSKFSSELFLAGLTVTRPINGQHQFFLLLTNFAKTPLCIATHDRAVTHINHWASLQFRPHAVTNWLNWLWGNVVVLLYKCNNKRFTLWQAGFLGFFFWFELGCFFF